MTTVSKSGAQSGAPLELLKLAFLLSKPKLKSEFEKVQVEINSEEDLVTLSELYKNKIDVSGDIKDGDNNPVMFDTMQVLKNIRYNESEKNLVLNNPSNFTA